VLLHADHPDASLSFHFSGTMVGLYDIMGPGTGAYEVLVDGRFVGRYVRFDAYSTNWRPQYFLIQGLSRGIHTVTFRVSGATVNKTALLAAKVSDWQEHPEKYQANACYAGYLLLDGTLVP
jgi:predicted RNA-binding protein with PUA domain